MFFLGCLKEGIEKDESGVKWSRYHLQVENFFFWRNKKNNVIKLTEDRIEKRKIYFFYVCTEIVTMA